MFNLFGNRTNGQAFRRIGIGEFEAMRTGNDAPLLLDVREPFEIATYGAIPGVLNIPLGELRTGAGKLPEDKGAPIVAICQSGARSQQAAGILSAMGYRNIYSLDGGTLGWLSAKRP
jgi:rhodanese-related sulfurtransferase